MSTILPPIFAAEARLLTDAFLTSERAQVDTLLKVMVPDVCGTPARMKRLNDAIGEWLHAGPRSWKEVEEVRREFVNVFESHTVSVKRVSEVAREVGLPAEVLDRLEKTSLEMERLHSQIFDHWRPFSRADMEQALAEIRQGKFKDIDEVIRELQARGD